MKKENVHVADGDGSRLLDVVHAELQMAILIARFAGLRFGEILDMKWADVDWSRRVLYVYSPTTHKRRAVPISRELRRQLLLWRRRRNGADPVFATPRARARLVERLRGLTALLGIERISFYDFRRWFGGGATDRMGIRAAQLRCVENGGRKTRRPRRRGTV